MATISEIATRLLTRFDSVPGVDLPKAEAWTQDALEMHGYTEVGKLPESEIYLVLMLAEANGARQIALQTAHYFKYQDGDESVDKSGVSDRYAKLAQSLRDEYRKEVAYRGQSSVKFSVAKRLDRF